jgi:hypothetical protein
MTLSGGCQEGARREPEGGQAGIRRGQTVHVDTGSGYEVRQESGGDPKGVRRGSKDGYILPVGKG